MWCYSTFPNADSPLLPLGLGLSGGHTDRFLPEHKARSGRQERRPVITWLRAMVRIKARLSGQQIEVERKESEEGSVRVLHTLK